MQQKNTSWPSSINEFMLKAIIQLLQLYSYCRYMLFELINYLVMGLGGLYPTYNKGEVLRESKKIGIGINL